MRYALHFSRRGPLTRRRQKARHCKIKPLGSESAPYLMCQDLQGLNPLLALRMRVMHPKYRRRKPSTMQASTRQLFLLQFCWIFFIPRIFVHMTPKGMETKGFHTYVVFPKEEPVFYIWGGKCKFSFGHTCPMSIVLSFENIYILFVFS